jgi:hypothetical protein
MFSMLLDSVDSHCPPGFGRIGPEEHKALLDDTLPSLQVLQKGPETPSISLTARLHQFTTIPT